MVMYVLLLAALVLLGICIYLIALLVREVMYLRDELQHSSDVDHAKCIAAVSAFVGDTFAAQVLRVAADDYDRPEEVPRLTTLARLHYHAGGPSMPSIWMRDRADHLMALTDEEG